MQKTLATLLAVSLIPAVAQAAVITPNGVTATDELGNYPAGETINGAGLNDSDPDVLNWTHDPTPSNTNSKSWLGAVGSELVYTLAGSTTIDTLYFWHYYTNNSTRELSALDISFSSDGTNYSATQTINLGTPGPNAEAYSLGTQNNVTHVKLSNLVNGGDNLAGIGEVRFGVIPEPGSLALLGFGGLLVASRRRRS